MGLKVCYVCHSEKENDLFRKGKNKCVECHKKYMTEYYLINKDKILKGQQINSSKLIIGSKVCVECNIEYDNKFFTQNRKQCNKCRKKSNKKYYSENKDSLLLKQKNYILNNKDKQKDYFYKNKDKRKEYMKLYYQNNKDKINKQKEIYSKNRRNNDSLYKLKYNIRRSINISLRNKGFVKKSKTEIILCCSINDFFKYLESKFEPWMNWNNYGLYDGTLNYGWDIDHIEPLANAKTEEEILRLNHYTNLQPLCSYTNRNIKKDNFG